MRCKTHFLTPWSQIGHVIRSLSESMAVYLQWTMRAQEFKYQSNFATIFLNISVCKPGDRPWPSFAGSEPARNPGQMEWTNESKSRGRSLNVFQGGPQSCDREPRSKFNRLCSDMKSNAKEPPTSSWYLSSVVDFFCGEWNVAVLKRILSLP